MDQKTALRRNVGKSRGSRDAQMTRAAILVAARKRFSENGYDQTGTREIAGLVGADKKLITHYFGSKENLFAEALDSAAKKFETPDHERSLAFSVAFVERIFGPSALSETDRHEFINLCIYSAASPTGKHLVAANIREQIAKAAAMLEGEDAQLRAALVLVTVLGLSLLREVLKIEQLVDLSLEKASAYIAPILQRLVDAPARQPVPVRKL